jgi:hypothetical protein
MPKTMPLPVTITDAEKLVILAEVSGLLTDIEALEAEKKALPEKIKTRMGSVNMKNHALAAGVIEREVEIREEPNAFSAKVKIFRVDTGAFVEERNMDPEEAQMQLGQSSVPGPTPDNVRSLAEHREKTEEQLAAGTPEEAEALREARLADERDARINEQVAALPVEIIARGPEAFVAQVTGEVPGVASARGLSGPIRSTPEQAKADLLAEVRNMIVGVEVAAAVGAATAQAEVAELVAEQAEDDATTKPKKLLQAPKGHKGKKGGKGKAAAPAGENPNGVDTTPPPAPDGGEPLGF